MKATLTAAALLALVAVPAAAQNAPTFGCTTAESRQFDFWIGDWVVENAQGQVMGTNRIDNILDGCALQENWEGSRGGSGKSFNAYSPRLRQWHQTWVANSGGVLLLDGALENGAMVLRGTTANPAGQNVLNRVTWTPLPDGRVRQHWEVSSDNGTTWSTSFDGYYRRRS